MSSQSSVLIVDPSDETCEVLQTALEHRGVRTLAAARADQGLQVARRSHPAIIVLSLAMGDPVDAAISSGFADHADEQKASLVVIGSARRAAEAFPHAEFVSAPYHYGPLVRRIEELLRDGAAGTPEVSGDSARRAA